MNQITKNVRNTLKDEAIKQAKILADEPFEVMQTAREMFENRTNTSGQTSNPKNDIGHPTEQHSNITGNTQKQDNLRIKELESELKQIESANLVSELQRRISQGETIYLADYPQIPIEQKQVLLAQMEAYQTRKQREDQSTKQLINVGSKPGRKFQGVAHAMKTKLTDLSRRSEIRMPPSG